MNELEDFARRVEARIKAADREPHWEPDAAAQYMAAVDARREQFVQLAGHLHGTVILPRLATLAKYFVNAKLVNDPPVAHCSCWFGYSERYPANAKVDLGIEHDAAVQQVAVSYAAGINPPLVPLGGQDRLTLPLGDVPEDVVASWVEQRLLEFLDAYQQIDRGREDFDEDTVTDVVCGMRLRRSAAADSITFRGYPYFFCSAECRERFRNAPESFVSSVSGS